MERRIPVKSVGLFFTLWFRPNRLSFFRLQVIAKKIAALGIRIYNCVISRINPDIKTISSKNPKPILVCYTRGVQSGARSTPATIIL